MVKTMSNPVVGILFTFWVAMVKHTVLENWTPVLFSNETTSTLKKHQSELIFLSNIITSCELAVCIFFRIFTWQRTPFVNYRLKAEAVTHRYSVKKLFLKILQNSQENTCPRDSFLMTCRSQAYNFTIKETLEQVFPCEFCKIFKNTFFYKKPVVAASTKDCNITNIAFELEYCFGNICAIF